MAGITQNKEKCLIFIAAPQGSTSFLDYNNDKNIINNNNNNDNSNANDSKKIQPH